MKSFSTAQTHPGISGSTLKYIALITMFIDHIGSILLEGGLLPIISSAVFAGNSFDYLPADYDMWSHINLVLRLIGRISFPLYCFLLVEGFLHTKNLRRYAFRLGLLAVLSEIPYDFARFDSFFNLEMQNVYFTLFLGLCTLWALKSFDDLPPAQAPFKYLVVLVGAMLAHFLQTDYGAFGVLLIVVLYLFRFDRMRQSILGAICTVWEYTAPAAFLLTYRYDGTRGKQLPKWFFYGFYPMHLLLLACLRMLLL